VPAPRTQRSRALALLGQQPILRLKDFTAQDVGPETLARLVREGMIVRVARGLYQRANASADAGQLLRVPLEQAAQDRGLTNARDTDIQDKLTITAPASARGARWYPCSVQHDGL
jgi:Transcriptional regulator, AbiEi antitoxin